MESIWVLGAGGHARVLIDTLRAEGRYRPVGVLDDNVSRLGSHVLGVPVLGGIDPEALPRLDIRLAVIAIGDNRVRLALAQRLEGLVRWGTAIHPRSHVSPETVVGDGTVILAGAIVQTGARLGAQVILNTASSVDHDSTLGPGVHIAPGGRVGGRVEIGDGALIGMGATVLSGRSVGPWATLGAGAVAVANIPAERTAIGVPARLLPPVERVVAAGPEREAS